MLRSASELGYTPSTLTLVRIFESMPPEAYQKASKTQLFLAADARFQALVREGTDPDALTLRGIVLAKAGDAKRALASFRRAVTAWNTSHNSTSAGVAGQAGYDQSPDGVAAAALAAGQQEYVLPAPREPRWEWEVSCILGQADILRGQGSAEEAHGLLRIAALELDHPRAFLELAKLMPGPRDSPERRAYLLKAATSGEAEACRELGRLERAAAAQRGLSNKERAELDMISKEWFRLADGEGLREIEAEAVADS